MRLHRSRLLQSLSRFDAATVEDLCEVFGTGSATKQAVWRGLNEAVKAGLVEKEGKPGGRNVYRVKKAA